MTPTAVPPAAPAARTNWSAESGELAGEAGGSPPSKLILLQPRQNGKQRAHAETGNKERKHNMQAESASRERASRERKHTTQADNGSSDRKQRAQAGTARREQEHRVRAESASSERKLRTQTHWARTRAERNSI